MLSFNQKDDGKIVAVFSNPYKNKSKYVYLNKVNAEDKIDKETLKELLRLKFGIKAQYKVQQRELKSEVRNDESILNAPSGYSKDSVFLPFLPLSFGNSERVVSYIFGKSGVGKSTMAKNLAFFFSKIMPVYLISPVKDASYPAKIIDIGDLVEVNTDDDYEKQKKEYEKAKIRFKHRKKQLDDDNMIEKLEVALVEMKPTIKKKVQAFKTTDKCDKIVNGSPCMFIFDDNEAESQQQKLNLNKFLLTGRHLNVNLIILNHHGNNGYSTRNIINEAHSYTFFKPFTRYINYFLTTYLEFSQRQVRAVRKLLKTEDPDEYNWCSIYPHGNIMMNNKKIIRFFDDE